MTDDAELQRNLYDVYDDAISQLLSLPIYVDRDGVDTVLGSDFEAAVNNLAMARDLLPTVLAWKTFDLRSVFLADRYDYTFKRTMSYVLHF